MRHVPLILCLSLLFVLGPHAQRTAYAQATESIEQALCRLIEGSAAKNRLPVDFLTRLIWRESSFRPHVTSPAGAQGVAQFMPGTAAERRLADPFDPEQAIPEAAAFLADLVRQFGNLGLAAAAYNGGPTRVATWLDGKGGLPLETRNYVLAITSRPVDDWAKARDQVDEASEAPAGGRLRASGRASPEGEPGSGGGEPAGALGRATCRQFLEGPGIGIVFASLSKLRRHSGRYPTDDHRHTVAQSRHPRFLPRPRPGIDPSRRERTVPENPLDGWKLPGPSKLMRAYRSA